MLCFGVAAPARAVTAAAPPQAKTQQAAPAAAGEAAQPRAAMRLEQGTYVIHSVGAAAGSGLGIGPVPLVYPPFDVPARYFDGGGFVERWVVKAVGDGRYTITAGQGDPDDYSLTPRGQSVFLSAVRGPGQWLIQPAGDGTWTVAAPDGDDEVVTLQRDEIPQLILVPQDGSADQRWQFIRVDG